MAASQTVCLCLVVRLNHLAEFLEDLIPVDKLSTLCLRRTSFQFGLPVMKSVCAIFLLTIEEAWLLPVEVVAELEVPLGAEGRAPLVGWGGAP